jgi:hypothetical protein
VNAAVSQLPNAMGAKEFVKTLRALSFLRCKIDCEFCLISSQSGNQDLIDDVDNPIARADVYRYNLGIRAVQTEGVGVNNGR